MRKGIGALLLLTSVVLAGETATTTPEAKTETLKEKLALPKEEKGKTEAEAQTQPQEKTQKKEEEKFKVLGKSLNAVDYPRPGARVRPGGMMCYYLENFKSKRILGGVLVRVDKNGVFRIPKPQGVFPGAPHIACRGYLKVAYRDKGGSATEIKYDVRLTTKEETHRAPRAWLKIYKNDTLLAYCQPKLDEKKYNQTGEIVIYRDRYDFAYAYGNSCGYKGKWEPAGWRVLTIYFKPYKGLNIPQVVNPFWEDLSRNGVRLRVKMYYAEIPGPLGVRTKEVRRDMDLRKHLYYSADVLEALAEDYKKLEGQK